MPTLAHPERGCRADVPPPPRESRSAALSRITILVALSDWVSSLVSPQLERIGIVRRIAQFGMLPSILAAEVADVLIFDPCVVRLDLSDRILSTAWECGRPTILLVDQSAAALSRILRAAGMGHSNVVLRAPSLDLGNLEQRILAGARESIVGKLLVEIARRLDSVPIAISGAIVAMLLGSPVPPNVGAFAQQCGIPRRSLDRWIRRAGLVGAMCLLDIIRVARLLEFVEVEGCLRQPDLSHLGYASDRAMRSDLKRYAGLRLRDLAGSTDLGEVASRLVPSFGVRLFGDFSSGRELAGG